MISSSCTLRGLNTMSPGGLMAVIILRARRSSRSRMTRRKRKKRRKAPSPISHRCDRPSFALESGGPNRWEHPNPSCGTPPNQVVLRLSAVGHRALSLSLSLLVLSHFSCRAYRPPPLVFQHRGHHCHVYRDQREEQRQTVLAQAGRPEPEGGNDLLQEVQESTATEAPASYGVSVATG